MAPPPASDQFGVSVSSLALDCPFSSMPWPLFPGLAGNVVALALLLTACGGTDNEGTGEINEASCKSECGNRVCGPDPVCGSLCGACAAGLECVAGECRAATPLAENGATCSANGECASGQCAQSQVGETRCYGNGGANDICGDVFDCSAGICLAPIPGTSTRVCVPGIDVCYYDGVSDPCIDFSISFCQLIQICDEDVSDAIPLEWRNFDYCIGSECSAANDGVADLTPAECEQATAAIASGIFGCP